MSRLTCAAIRLLAAALAICSCAQPGGQKGGVRAVSLVPSVTEIVYAVGAGDRLVGNTTACDFPEAARSVYKVGDFVNPDLEKLAALKPTVVFLALPVHAALAAKLTEMKVPYYASRPADLDAVVAEVESVGARVGRTEAAGAVSARMQFEIAAVEPAADSPRVYAEISSTPPMTAGGATFVNDIIRRAGGRNVFADALQEYPVVDQERLVRLDPEVILVLHPAATAEDVRARIGWAGVSAVRNGRVYDGLDEDLLFRPGPRVVQGLRQLAELLRSGPSRQEE
ncbi:MAG: cobalamin-binding protein [bacterium]